jgi:hypothetical protein
MIDTRGFDCWAIIGFYKSRDVCREIFVERGHKISFHNGRHKGHYCAVGHFVAEIVFAARPFVEDAP